MDAREKAIVWLHGEVKTPPFSAEARIEIGVLLRRLQQGEKLSMPHSRPMTGIGSGCHELRVPDKRATFIDKDAIVILEIFDEKTTKTPAEVMANCRRRLGAYKAAVKQGGA